MEEFNQTKQGRVPAEQTLKFIHRAESKFDKVETTMILWAIGFLVMGAIAAAVFRLIFK